MILNREFFRQGDGENLRANSGVDLTIPLPLAIDILDDGRVQR